MTAPDPRPRSWRYDDARRLSPGPDGSGALRWTVLLLGLVLVAGAVGALATTTWAATVVDRGYEDVPATYDLGTPESLTVETRVADLTVIRDPEAPQVTAALVEPGTTVLPPAGETVRARVTLEGDGAERGLRVEQPGTSPPVPWMTSHRTLLLILPSDLEVSLEATTSVGDIEAEGTFRRLSARTDLGDVELSDLVLAEDLSVTSEIGDVDLSLADSVPGGIDVANSLGSTTVRLAPASEGDLTVTTDIGDIEVTAPGSGRYTVEANADGGTRTIDPDLRADGDESLGTITVTSEAGDVLVGR